ncbi:STAS domain-containing protein [Endothiovibrio diazotrophicus]
MSEEHESLIGFDPLAWMREEETSAAPAPAPAAIPPVPPATRPAPPEPASAPLEAAAEAADDGREVATAAESAAESVAAVEPLDEGVVVLGEALDIAHVGELYERLVEVLRQGRQPALDATALERVDAAGVQLLAAYGRELKGLGGRLEWRGEPAAPLREAARLLDLGEALGLAA